MRKVQQTAYAKINLSLDVLGRRDDGYHIVRMIMQTIDLYDELTFETQDRECPAMEVILETDSGELSCGEDNLIVRAVRCMDTASASGVCAEAADMTAAAAVTAMRIANVLPFIFIPYPLAVAVMIKIA